jgi:hypothetical protein
MCHWPLRRVLHGRVMRRQIYSEDLHKPGCLEQHRSRSPNNVPLKRPGLKQPLGVRIGAKERPRGLPEDQRLAKPPARRPYCVTVPERPLLRGEGYMTKTVADQFAEILAVAGAGRSCSSIRAQPRSAGALWPAPMLQSWISRNQSHSRTSLGDCWAARDELEVVLLQDFTMINVLSDE